MPASEVMGKWKAGTLHSGSKKGPVVGSQKQAIAIMLSERRAEGKHGGKYPEKQFGGPQFNTGQPPFPGQFGLNHPMPGQAMPPGMQGMPQPMQGFGTPQMGMPPPGMGMGDMGMGRGYAFGGSPTSMGLTPGWIERQEARSMTHTGPIISGVGGRTDHHAINVPSGSYVLPAAHVSAMGQGNTLNGMQVLRNMFGPPMNPRHGPGPPRPPKMMGMASGPKMAGMASSGGSRGDGHVGQPVPIMAAGGEFVLSPDQVAKVGGGNLDHGHAILDHWVKKTHKKYAKTVANLPPPAKT